MRTSLTEIRENERYLNGTLPPDEKLVAEARRLTNPERRINFRFQLKVLRLVQLYRCQTVRRELMKTHDLLFQDPAKAAFQATIRSLFKK